MKDVYLLRMTRWINQNPAVEGGSGHHKGGTWMFTKTVLILYLSLAKPFINKWVKSSANVLQSKQLIDKI